MSRLLRNGNSATATWGNDAPRKDAIAVVPRKIGRYEIDRLLGSGGYARVYLTNDTQLQRKVALKVPRGDRYTQEQLGRFMTEAQTVASLPHAGIVQVHDVGVDDNTHYIVMQYVNGSTLSERMRQGLSVEEAIDIVIQIADTLHFAHSEHSTFHRDVKPINILVSHDGTAFVADFGLAISKDMRASRRGEVAGTLSFMSPEQLRGESNQVDGRSDI